MQRKRRVPHVRPSVRGTKNDGANPSKALGSLWGLFVNVLTLPALIWRLLSEEDFLAKNLPGYTEYQNTVRHRLAPFLW
jgi:protein-S-isoprenylcysteine O-methyltransferase Ste14